MAGLLGTVIGVDDALVGVVWGRGDFREIPDMHQIYGVARDCCG